VSVIISCFCFSDVLLLLSRMYFIMLMSSLGNVCIHIRYIKEHSLVLLSIGITLRLLKFIELGTLKA
jgi:hypothetical protein